ncbi:MULTISPECIES: hypothetical protein [unclassified Streptomyces]|uniref:hypothetical protein n=1 Tax=unclassified Streptomyces TaxID=2593676 RepID=UPI0006FD3EFE|nr:MULTISPECIES: hypothetical protein [unclassified Streptomyces]KQX56281.1 hypothetical protein ASD33_30000 [Streptomyces sp. Root1304]KRA97096.1 hypothetical protein ASE09_26810 [Streptomyces sp. Root66D1]
MSRLSRWSAVLAVLAPLALAGCSSPPPALEFGAAGPSGPELAARPADGGSLPVAEWPNACEVLSDDEIRSILPQATDFAREPVKVTIIDFNPLAQSAPGTTGDVEAGGCTYKFGLPSAYESTHNSSIRVTFTAIADPSLVRQSYAEDLADARKDAPRRKKEFRDLGTSLGAAGCFLPDVSDGPTCYRGPYQFEVGGMSTADGVGEYAESDKNWSAKVLTEVARTVSARIP